MSRLSTLTKLVSLSLVLGSSLLAQESKWEPSFKLFGGYLIGAASDDVLGKNPVNFGAGVEAAYKLDKNASLVLDLGYRFYPGDTQFVSYFQLPATGTVGQVVSGESRVRKTQIDGFQASALYRRDAFMDGMFWQAGLRLGFNKAKQTDTGSASSYTRGATTWNVTSVSAIDSVVEKKKTSIGLLAGLGYRFNDRYTGGLNVYTAQFEDPTIGKKSGTVAEFDFGIRF